MSTDRMSEKARIWIQQEAGASNVDPVVIGWIMSVADRHAMEFVTAQEAVSGQKFEDEALQILASNPWRTLRNPNWADERLLRLARERRRQLNETVQQIFAQDRLQFSDPVWICIQGFLDNAFPVRRLQEET